jgi:hypothetical protein
MPAEDAVVEIDKQDLAEMAAVAFRDSVKADIPEKIWVDGYGGVAFLRATWGDGITAKRVDKLQALQQLLAAGYEIEVVAVAYWHDMPWDRIDGMASALQTVR